MLMISRAGFPTPISLPNANLSSLQWVLVTNLPQLAYSVCYLAFNNLVTRMLTEREWTQFSIEYTVLRVSAPEGLQTSSLRLQLPKRVSVPDRV